MSKFTDKEIEIIKLKFNEKFKKALIVTLLISPLLCAISPYIPSKRSGNRLIDSMGYYDALIFFSIFWFIAIFAVWVWNRFKSESDFSNIRRFLEKKQTQIKILDKRSSIFISYKNWLITDNEKDFDEIKVNKEQTQRFEIGDTLLIVYDNQTKAILSVKKEKQKRL